MAELDTDKSGDISFDEFKARPCARVRKQQQQK